MLKYLRHRKHLVDKAKSKIKLKSSIRATVDEEDLSSDHSQYLCPGERICGVRTETYVPFTFTFKRKH